MNWELLWDYFGDFDDREFVRWLVIAMFAFGIPIAIGLWAMTIRWVARQIDHCRRALAETSEPTH